MNQLPPSLMKPALAALIASFLIGCAHEENTDFQRANFNSRKPLKSHYSDHRQLSDLDVIGSPVNTPSDEDIRRALDRSSAVDLKRGQSLLVVQSGEPIPDTRMVNELNKHFRAVPFSGLRGDWAKGESKESEVAPDFYARMLRMAAAQAGAEKILCFWGSLEVARHDLSTKTVTWLPVIDVFVPDEKNKVRVHLKMAIVDVRSGAWTILRTEPQEGRLVSTGWAREHIESAEVRTLKEKSFVVAVTSLVNAN